MGISVGFSLLNSLDTSKIKKKEQYVEYVLHIGDDKYALLILESDANNFEEKFSKLQIDSYDDFINEFGHMVQ